MILWDEAANFSGPVRHLLLGGDFCPIRRCEQAILAGAPPVFAPELSDIFGASDLFAVNLESPLCDNLTAEGASGLNASAAMAGKLKDFHIGLVGLANNHLRDFGDEGVRQTLRELDRVGMPHTGAGENLAQAQRMKIMDLDGFKLGVWALAEKEQNVASPSRPGSAWFQPEVNVHEIPKLRAQVDFLLLFVHAGHEFMLTPSPRIRDAYRRFVAAGADAVIGHHPHVVQGIEKYRDGWIAYSLGNLLFDSRYVFRHDHTRLGFLVRLAIGTHQVGRVELAPYRIEEALTVATLSSAELKDFRTLLAGISAHLHDEQVFRREWERNARRCWHADYEDIYRNLSKRLFEDKDPHFPRMLNNFLTCPTHGEMMDEVTRQIGQEMRAGGRTCDSI